MSTYRHCARNQPVVREHWLVCISHQSHGIGVRMNTICVFPQHQLCTDYVIVLWVAVQTQLHNTDQPSLETPPLIHIRSKMYSGQGNILRFFWTLHRHTPRFLAPRVHATISAMNSNRKRWRTLIDTQRKRETELNASKPVNKKYLR